MNKGHKTTQSFAGGAKGKGGAGAKKNPTATHKAAQSNANINQEKKGGAKGHKPEVAKKGNVSKNEESTKTEKSTAQKKETPAPAATAAKKETPNPTPTPTPTPEPVAKERPSASSSAIQSALDSKKANDEKREINKKLDALKKENIDLKKKVTELDKLNNDLMNEITESQSSSEQFIKERNDMEEITKKAQGDLKLVTQRNEELTKQLDEMKDDLEIYKEESETKDLEMQLLQKKFDEYKVKAEAEIKKAKLNATKAQGTEGAPKGEEGKTESEGGQPSTTESGESPSNNLKIVELEDIINDLSNQLNSTAEQRDYAISFYKGEMEKLNKNIEELKSKSSIIPEKDELIRQLTEKLKEDEGIIDSLKSQINVLSPANDMYEELIMEKDELERNMEEIKTENEQLKDTMKDNDEMIADLEEALQISEKVMKDSQNEALTLKNKLEAMEAKAKEYEENQTQLLSKIEDLKNKNKMLNEDTASLKGTSQNINNIWIEYLTSKNIIQNLKRQKIISEIYEIDNDKFLLRNKIVKNMIPKKLLESGNIGVFDKFLNITSYRKKIFKLILNQLNNEILTDDLGINPNKVEEDKMGKVEGEEKKKLISFYESTMDTFTEFYSYLLKVEIFLCELNSEQFLKVNNETSFNEVYNSIIGGSSIFDMIINLIKSDSFGIQYKSNIDGLKNINTQIKTEMAGIENMEENKLYLYLINLLKYFLNICCGFKKERIDIIVDDLDKNEKLKSVADSFIDSNKNLNNIIEKVEPVFFKPMSYKLGNTIFDTENANYKTLTQKIADMETELNNKTEFDSKYAALIEIFNKVCIVMTSALEKGETNPKPEEGEEKVYEDDRVTLPVKEWNNITDVLYDDLENITKVTEELENTRIEIEEEKNKNMEWQIKYENLEKMKKENDGKLGELMVKLGKYSQLEASNEENSKKIQKYQIAVEGLQNTVNEYEKKEKEYLEKIETLEKKEKEKRHMKKATGIDFEKLKFSNNKGEEEGGENINGAGLLNTVIILQRDRKNYKNKFMKEKLYKLMDDKDSYINRYIKKDFKISKKDNEKEKEMYRNIQDKVISLNRGYDKIRKKLCLPKVLDLSSNEYNYEKEKKQQEDEIEKTRLKYIEDADRIFYHMFGENSNSKTIKEIVNSDMSKTLSMYGDKKYLIGKLQFSDAQKGEGENKDLSGSLYNSKNTIGVPVIINEDGFRKINESFIH